MITNLETYSKKLTQYNCLGYLGTLQENERFNYLKSSLDNQLLVAYTKLMKLQLSKKLLLMNMKRFIRLKQRLRNLMFALFIDLILVLEPDYFQGLRV